MEPGFEPRLLDLSPSSSLQIMPKVSQPCNGKAGVNAGTSVPWSRVFLHRPALLPVSYFSWLPSTFCLTLLPVRTRPGRLWTPALMKGPGKQAHLLWLGWFPGCPSPWRPNSWPSARGWEEHLSNSAFPVGRGQCTRLENGMSLIAGGRGWED